MIEYTERFFRGLDMWSLRVDEAFLNVSGNIFRDYFLYTLLGECEKCPYTKIGEIKPNNVNVFKLDVSRTLALNVQDRDVGKYDFQNVSSKFKFHSNLEEFGVYQLNIIDEKTGSLGTLKEPVNIYLPFLTIALIVLVLTTVMKYYHRINSPPTPLLPASPSSEQTNEPQKTRLRSLDTFRGIAIMLMIFVNSGGGHYWWIEHAIWNGLHVADLVFPWFLFIMGVCIPISLHSQVVKKVPQRTIFRNIAVRALKLFCLGLFLNSINGPQMSDLRLFGVLQRFGVAYFVVSTIHLYFYTENIQVRNDWLVQIHDIISLWKQWIIMGIILSIYLLIIFLVPAPGCPSGYFGPGGKHLMLTQPKCTGGITGYIDRAILGNNHLYQHSTFRKVYDAPAFDPEGPFGCLPTIFQVFLGLQCGMLLLTHKDVKARIIRLAVWGIFIGLLGGILCDFSKNDGWIPVNKNLWSISYVLATTSLSFFLLLICYWLIDVKQIWTGNPFFYAGMNAIILYVGHSVFHKMLPWHWKIGLMNTHFMLMCEALWNTFLWNIIAYYLFKKNLFYSL